jgi:hypothetical protein
MLAVSRAIIITAYIAFDVSSVDDTVQAPNGAGRLPTRHWCKPARWIGYHCRARASARS